MKEWKQFLEVSLPARDGQGHGVLGDRCIPNAQHVPVRGVAARLVVTCRFQKIRGEAMQQLQVTTAVVRQ